MEKVKLGQEVKDRITGFKGIATSRTTYLQGCERIGVSPPVDKEGKLPEPESFDEPDLIVLSEGVLPREKPNRQNGGPRQTPNMLR